jgi:hypothetical protein
LNDGAKSNLDEKRPEPSPHRMVALGCSAPRRGGMRLPRAVGCCGGSCRSRGGRHLRSGKFAAV